MTYPVTFLTLFPEMFPGPLGFSLPGRALERGLWECYTLNIRDFATGKHANVDDTPYGGGAGMVMRPDIVGAAIEQAQAATPDAQLVHLTPRGTPLTQQIAEDLATQEGLILLCGRFEGVDERVAEHYRPLEISLGDFVLFGGEVAAMALVESVLRHIPESLGNAETHREESFALGEESALLLEYPHYTKPPSWKGLNVPEVLLSGHHEHISRWRREQAEEITRARRPELWERHCAGKQKKI